MTDQAVKFPTKLTFKRAQQYLASKGLELSTAQVRNIAKTSDLVEQIDYVDPITEETHKVLTRDSLDKYMKWRAENPQAIGRGGNRAAKDKRVDLRIPADRLDELNQVLAAAGFPAATLPVRKAADPNAPKRQYKRRGSKADSNASNAQPEAIQPDINELELIEVA